MQKFKNLIHDIIQESREAHYGEETRGLQNIIDAYG